MEKKLKLLMAIHCHQPVGNFDHVFEEAFRKAYLPFLETLERHPRIRVVLHYSGSLIDWLELHQPEFTEHISKLLKRNQIELLSCGYYEPILVLLPEEDKIGQINLLNEKINSLWAVKAEGAWLTERIWEPSLAKVFNATGIKYTIVDDSHFEKAGKNPEELWGYYVTEEEGKILNVFPGSKFLRYALPFKLPEETIKYLREFFHAGKQIITFADDGEKFGLWPHTYKWVYEEKWLENFFSTLEDNYNWIEMITFKECIEKYPPTERIYLPCASYSEMLDWSDGYFRNFLVRYPESNNMHKKMLEVSSELSKFTANPSTWFDQAHHKSLGTGSKQLSLDSRMNQARQHLYMAQNNDSYWHGVFGGLYLNHLRYSVYSNLIKAEKIINDLKYPDDNWLHNAIFDFDYDGQDELILENTKIKAYIDIGEKASIFELDYKAKTINLINTLARRKEKYHEKIKERILKKNYASVQGTTSIHDLEKDIPEGLDKLLFYDRYRKACLQEYLLQSNTTLEDFSTNRFIEIDSSCTRYKIETVQKTKNKLSATLKRSFDINGQPFEIEKLFGLESGSSKLNFEYAITNNSRNPWKGKFGVEFNFSLWDEILAGRGERENVYDLLIKDSWFGIEIFFTFDLAARIWHFPIETVYESESSFEKNFQGLDILFHWDIALEPGSNWQVHITQDIKC